MNKLLLVLASFALVTMPLVAPAAAQDGQTVEITATAMESGCGDRTYCWEIDASGSFQPGDTLEITVVNPESNGIEHNFYIMNGTPDQEGGGTDEEEAGWNTDNLQPDDEATLTVPVGEGVEELYYWCDVGAHENLGMYGTLTAGQDDTDGGADTGGDDGGDGTDGEGQSSSPGLGLVASLAGLAMAAYAVARRR